ncbi:unnamed protein product [Leuciscus chuanchicus]
MWRIDCLSLVISATPSLNSPPFGQVPDWSGCDWRGGALKRRIGGAETIKKYWSRYYQGSQGVVFVLNSAGSDEEMEASRSELHLAMQHPQLCTLPFLILANHQDSPAARSVLETLSTEEARIVVVVRTQLAVREGACKEGNIHGTEFLVDTNLLLLGPKEEDNIGSVVAGGL